MTLNRPIDEKPRHETTRLSDPPPPTGLIEEDGLLLFAGHLTGDICDITRREREERLHAILENAGSAWVNPWSRAGEAEE